MYKARNIAILAVIGPLLISALLFILATVETLGVLWKLLLEYGASSSYDARKSLIHYAMLRSIELTDVYLLGLVTYIRNWAVETFL